MKSNKKVELFVDLGLKEICGLISLLGTNRDAGIQEIIFCSSAISIDGISNDHTDAAIITPEANPSKSFSTLIFILFFIKNTIAAPKVVPANGISNPINNSIFIIFLSTLL